MLDAEIYQKYRGKSLAWLIDEAQKKVNAYVRRRDSVNGYFVCISCQELKPVNQMNAGHFWAKEFYKAVRFDLDNVSGQCVRCNHHLSGNLLLYRENLIKKIGLERFERLEKLSKLSNYQYDRKFLIELIERFKKL